MEFVKKISKFRTINVTVVILVMVLISGCAGKKPIDKLTIEERYKRGHEMLEKSKYYNAQQEFQIIVFTGSHTELGDDAQFYLAESYFKNEEYLLAINEYERLTRKMKFSPHVEQSRWRICEAYVALSPNYYHDQSNTDKALQKLQEFIEEYPDSEYRENANETVLGLRNKLAEKILKSAVLYGKLHAYDSAIVSYKNLLNQYYDTKYTDDAHFGIIKSHVLLQNVSDAEKYFTENEHKFNSPMLKQRVRQYLLSANSNK